VTPVVLPGHYDPRKLRRRLRDTTTPLTAAEKEQIIRKLDARIERLLRKAFLDRPGVCAPVRGMETRSATGNDQNERQQHQQRVERDRRADIIGQHGNEVRAPDGGTGCDRRKECPSVLLGAELFACAAEEAERDPSATDRHECREQNKAQIMLGENAGDDAHTNYPSTAERAPTLGNAQASM
jgi:hypothetical protein